MGLLNALYPCTPRCMWPATQLSRLRPPLLRQQGQKNKSCLSMFLKRETLQKLAALCWKSGASREWLHVGFFRISVCSYSCTYVYA